MRKLLLSIALVAAMTSCKARQEIKQQEVNVPAKTEVSSIDDKMAPDFTLKDIEGKDLKLSSLRGKYLVLDFWGSWCGWCIKGMPDMKKYYEKYGSKMEILGIDCGDTPEAWQMAVKKYELPWKHVYCPKGSNVPSQFLIEGYPTKFVIDPEGKIIKKVVGEDPEFYQYLDELFGVK